MEVKFTIKELMNSKKITRLFNLFKKLLPSHPDPENTYMVFKPHDKYWEILFICEHFEHSRFDDVIVLLGFMKALMDEFKTNEVYLTLLDHDRERLVIRIYTTNSRVIPVKVRRAMGA